MSAKNQWLESSNNFFLRETSIIKPTLPLGIYKTVELPSGEIFLQRISDAFDMPNKVYDFERKFLERMIKAYEENEKKSWSFT